MRDSCRKIIYGTCSDVNLAVHLLNDCRLDCKERAIMVSNDSYLAEAMRLVNKHLNKTIDFVTQRSKQRSEELRVRANFVRSIRPSGLQNTVAESDFRDEYPKTCLLVSRRSAE